MKVTLRKGIATYADSKRVYKATEAPFAVSDEDGKLLLQEVDPSTGKSYFIPEDVTPEPKKIVQVGGKGPGKSHDPSPEAAPSKVDEPPVLPDGGSTITV